MKSVFVFDQYTGLVIKTVTCRALPLLYLETNEGKKQETSGLFLIPRGSRSAACEIY